MGFVVVVFINSLWFCFSYDEEKKFEDIGKVVLMFFSFCYILFFLVMLYIGFCYGILVYFVNWYIDDIGGLSVIMGVVGVVREILVLIMFVMSVIIF